MIFDVVVLIIVLISCVTAFLRGFIREVLTILGVVGGIVASLSFAPVALPYLRDWLGAGKEEAPKIFGFIPPEIMAYALAYGGIFIVVVIVLSLVSHQLAVAARSLGLGALDRSMGVMFGLVRGVLLLSLLYLIPFTLVPKETRDKVLGDSKTRPMLELSTEHLAALLPGQKDAADDLGAKGGKLMDSMAKTTREKLQDIDVLEKKVAPAAAPAPDDQGYKDRQRQDMKKLIDNNLND